MRRGRFALTAVALGLAAVAAVAVVTLGRGEEGRSAASPSPTTSPTAVANTSTPSPSPALSPSASPSASASALPAGTFENAILGYRITLPDGYRRSQARVITGQDRLGGDYYTMVTEAEWREICMSDSGDVAFPALALGREPDIDITVFRNASHLSAAEWVRGPGQPYTTHHNVEPTTVGGHDAVRLVTDNAAAETSVFVINASGRIYLIHRPFGGGDVPRSWFEEIAKTFQVISAAPFPSPTATTPPRQAASALARQLAAAFGAKDADAVARLMPDCWLNVFPVSNGGGVLYRSVALFRDALRERFATGDLTVTVDPTVREDPREAGSFIVSSEWKEAGRTRRVDLHLVGRDGGWLWLHAAHHDGWPCHAPWVTTPSC